MHCLNADSSSLPAYSAHANRPFLVVVRSKFGVIWASFPSAGPTSKASLNVGHVNEVESCSVLTKFVWKICHWESCGKPDRQQGSFRPKAKDISPTRQTVQGAFRPWRQRRRERGGEGERQGIVVFTREANRRTMKKYGTATLSCRYKNDC